MKRKISLSVFLLWTITNCFSQSIDREVIGSAGNYSNTDDFSLSWTIGEPITETFSSNDYMLFQGFHQGEYIVEIPENIENGFGNIHFDLYPNPAGDFLIIKLNEPDKRTFKIHSYALNGKKLLSTEINPFENQKRLDLSNFGSGTYIIKIVNKVKSESFKLIIK